jgi:DNA-binding CsgD family transcriptional regulator
MPLDPQNTAQIRDRELRVWDLLLKGLEGIEIARREGVDPAVISRIKKRVERRIIAETDGKAQSLKARQISEIRRARREAWRAWEESCKPAAKTTRRSAGRGASMVEANEIKGQCGNAAFLDKVYDGIRLEARITGTEAPQQQHIEGRVRLEDLVAGSLGEGDGSNAGRGR